MIELDYAALATTPIANDPFPHIVIPRFVPEPLLGQVVQGLPALSKGGSFPVEGLRLGEAAQTLMAELAGVRFRTAIDTKFGLALC